MLLALVSELLGYQQEPYTSALLWLLKLISSLPFRNSLICCGVSLSLVPAVQAFVLLGALWERRRSAAQWTEGEV